MIAKLSSELDGVLLGATARDRLQIVRMFAHAHGRLGRARALFSWIPARRDRPQLVTLRSGVRVLARRCDGVPFYEQFALDVYGVELPIDVGTVLDVGANVGFAAVALARRYPAASFVCVEPSAASRSLLERNLAINQVRAEVMAAAVMGTPGRLSVVAGRAPGSDRVVRAATGEVEGVTVVEVLDRAGIDVVDLVKIDIEGAERGVFEHAAEWAGRVRAIVAELHGGFGVNDADALLAPHGYGRQVLPAGLRFDGVSCWIRR